MIPLPKAILVAALVLLLNACARGSGEPPGLPVKPEDTGGFFVQRITIAKPAATDPLTAERVDRFATLLKRYLTQYSGRIPSDGEPATLAILVRSYLDPNGFQKFTGKTEEVTATTRLLSGKTGAVLGEYPTRVNPGQSLGNIWGMIERAVDDEVEIMAERTALAIQKDFLEPGGIGIGPLR